MPIIQMFILVYTATLEMKHINLYVVDKDMSQTSRKLISKFEGSPFYYITGFSFSINDADEQMKKDEADVILHIPSGFEQKLNRENKSDIQLLINAINGMKAGLINAYSMNIITQFNQNVVSDLVVASGMNKQKGIDIRYRYWFNPDLDFKIFMLPGILVILVTTMGMFLSAISMVREKELGTIEQINVTPIGKFQFLAGKLMPFWIIALAELAFGLTIGNVFFNVPIEGSLLLLFGFSSVFLMVVIGIGLFFSTITNTQQQIMFLFFFFNIVFILMSGLFTPVESMPLWAQKVNYINPLAYFMRVIRMILLKGSGLQDVLKELYALSVYAVIIFSLAAWKYRKTT
jgi:ABC-2 type transport system permease protein